MNQQLTDILKQQLREAHTPDAISWWLLAPGWWVLAALLIALVSYSAVKLHRHRQKNNYRKIAIVVLDWHYSEWQLLQNDGGYLQAANSVIKRACSHFDNGSQKLSGREWVNYLNFLCKNELSDATQTALNDALYQKQPKTEIKKVHQDLRAWLVAHNRLLVTNIEVGADAAPAVEPKNA